MQGFRRLLEMAGENAYKGFLVIYMCFPVLSLLFDSFYLFRVTILLATIVLSFLCHRKSLNVSVPAGRPYHFALYFVYRTINAI